MTDDNSALPDAARSKTFTLGGDDLKNEFASRINHHNVCDNFALHLPHAVYAATGAPFGESVQGCATGAVVQDAPTRSVSDQSHSFYYQVKYGNGTWQHYIEACGDRGYMTTCQAPGGPVAAFPQ